MSAGLAQTYEGRILALEKQVASLSHSVARFEHRTHWPEACSADMETRAIESDVAAQLEAVRQLTVTMFPGDVSAEWEADPECPQDRFLVFHATATGELEDLIDRQRQWQREVLRLAPRALNLLRLSLAPA